jgi:hypothetical protein
MEENVSVPLYNIDVNYDLAANDDDSRTDNAVSR